MLAAHALVLLALAAQVQEEAVEIAGQLVALDSERLVVRTASGDLTLALDGRADLPAGLAPGDEVRVAYRSDPDGDVVERVVTVPTARVGPAETEVAEQMEQAGDWVGAATVVAILALVAAGLFALEWRARYRAATGRPRRAARTNRSSQR